MANNKITIYTDGAAQGNPGRGGYGVVLLSPPYRKELSEGFRLTTNNRMELLAVIKGLETLKFDGCEVTVFSRFPLRGRCRHQRMGVRLGKERL